MDVLSDVLRSVKMTGAFYFEATNYAPWVCGEPTAAEIGKRLMPQSVFAERFAGFVGMPAITNLTRWRLTLATRLLEDRTISIAHAGTEVGYDSEAAFNRAFKKHLGVAPGAWRRGRGGRSGAMMGNWHPSCQMDAT